MKIKISTIFLLLVIGLADVTAQQTNPVVLDLAVLFDISGSIGVDYFNAGKEILLNITKKLNAPKHSINLSILTFSSNIVLYRDLISDTNGIQNMLTSIREMNYENPQRTSTAFAIRYISRFVFNTKRDQAPRITLIITDGLFDHTEMSNGSIQDEMNRLVSLDVEVFSMPIADENNFDNIKQLVTSMPADDYFILPNELGRFYELINNRTVQVYDANAFYYFPL